MKQKKLLKILIVSFLIIIIFICLLCGISFYRNNYENSSQILKTEQTYKPITGKTYEILEFRGNNFYTLVLEDVETKEIKLFEFGDYNMSYDEVKKHQTLIVGDIVYVKEIEDFFKTKFQRLEKVNV